MKSKPCQSLVNFFQCLFAEIGNAQERFRFAVQEIADGEDAFLFQAIRRPDLKIDFGNAQFKPILSQTCFFISAA
jgi:hypothetical protein